MILLYGYSCERVRLAGNKERSYRLGLPLDQQPGNTGSRLSRRTFPFDA